MKKPAFKVYTTCTPPGKQAQEGQDVSVLFRCMDYSSTVSGLPYQDAASGFGNTRCDISGWTPLALAIYEENAEIVRQQLA